MPRYNATPQLISGTRGAIIWDEQEKLAFNRTDYNVVEAQLVADWLNGLDRPLVTMKARDCDPTDPLFVYEGVKKQRR